MQPRFADLFARLRDPDPDTRDAAFDAVLFERGRALPALVECYLTSRHDGIMRFYAIQLLGFSGDARAVPFVVQALQDADPAVRAEACRSLEDLEAVGEVGALEARLMDLDARVREAAEEALAGLQGLRKGA